MDTKTTLPISEARKKIFRIAKRVQKPSTFYTLTENGKPKVVIMSAEEFESWRETLEVLRIFPNLQRDLQQAEKEYKRGAYATLESVLSKEGFVIADKLNDKHVSSRSRGNSRKRSR